MEKKLVKCKLTPDVALKKIIDLIFYYDRATSEKLYHVVNRKKNNVQKTLQI